ncbi:MAG: helix-turn-helix transcriptional regulator [Clostridium sp.]
MKEKFEKLQWNEKIRILRIIEGWSQEEASQKCYTHQKAFWAWETGNRYPHKNNRRAIASAFDVEEEFIFG